MTRTPPTIPELMPGAQPFFYRGGDIGVLCLHGLTASPSEVSWLGAHLAEAGFTVYGPRITGHGANHSDLRRLRWEDWYLAALDGYHVLRAQCNQVFVSGLSMGALLSLMLGATQPVDGLIVMAAPLSLPDARRSMTAARWIKFVRPLVYLPDETDFPQRLRAEQAKRGEPLHGRVRYDWWAMQSLEELHELMGVTQAHLSQVAAPVLTIYSESDQTVPLFNQKLVLDGLGSVVKEAHTLKVSGHIMTQDSENDTVFELVTRFIQRYSGARDEIS